MLAPSLVVRGGAAPLNDTLPSGSTTASSRSRITRNRLSEIVANIGNSYRATNPHDRENWETMASIKSTILRIWDDAPPPVKICCVKFAQRVVLAQTTSNGMEQKVRVLQLCSMRRLVVLIVLRSAFRPRCLPIRHPAKSSHIRPPSSRSRSHRPPRPNVGNTTRQQQVSWPGLASYTCPTANHVFV